MIWEQSNIIKYTPSSCFIALNVRKYSVVRISLDFLRGDNEMMNPIMFGWEELHLTASITT